MDDFNLNVICSRIRTSGLALNTHHASVLRHHGLAMTQYLVLLALFQTEHGMSGSQLARECGVTQQSMAAVLAGLHTKGLIRRDPSPVHAKVQIATLKPAGRDIFQTVYAEVAALEKSFDDAFSQSERKELIALLDRATKVLIAQTRHPTDTES